MNPFDDEFETKRIPELFEELTLDDDVDECDEDRYEDIDLL